MKQYNNNAWASLPPELKVGGVVKGTVSSIAPFGLFVTVAKDIVALVHISEISWTERINDINRYYKVGDPVEAVIVSIDPANRRMSLSIKQLTKRP